MIHDLKPTWEPDIDVIQTFSKSLRRGGEELAIF